MSEGLKNKMYHYEVTPPASAWEKIRQELDGQVLSSSTLKKMQQLEANPPADTWQKISRQLDESGFSGQVAASLGNIEVNPPARTWNKIRLELDSETAAESQPARKLIPWMKYAGAAVFFGLLTLTGIRLLNNNQSTEKSSATAFTTNTVTELPATANNPVAQTTEKTSDDMRNDAALEESKHTFAKLDLPAKTRMRGAAAFSFVAKPSYSVTTRGLDMEDYTQEPEPPMVAEPAAGASGRYIVMMTPEGNIVRISKKLSDLVCCVSGQEQDFNCSEQMQKWRTQLACTEGTHSPGNFMDILSLIATLDNE
ncbi:MAG: hypothetical protein IPP73_06845 [Chitinophagaceae bacterium]|nr:hypothetical protein [Chitinophagaceae bacterium]